MDSKRQLTLVLVCTMLAATRTPLALLPKIVGPCGRFHSDLTIPASWRFPMLSRFHRNHHESPRTQGQDPGRPSGFCRGAAGRKRIQPAQAGHDVRDPQAPCRERHADLGRGRPRDAVGRVRLPALARGQLSGRAGRHLRVALPDPALFAAHRRHRRGRDPRAQGRRALFRAAQGRQGQFRRAGKGAPPHQLRQSDAAVPGREAQARAGPAGQERHDDAHRRHDHAARQGPARIDRLAAAHRQDDDAAVDRARDHGESSRGLPDRAADRRAAGGSHRHGSLGEGRGGRRPPSTSRRRATCRSRRW